MRNLLLIFYLFAFSFLHSQSCTHTIRLTDTFGDGWNGGTVSVSVNGVMVLNSITITAAQGGLTPINFNFAAASGSTIRVYRVLAGTWPSEMRVQIVNNVGTILLNTIQPVAGTATTGGYTCVASCSGGGGGGGCVNTSPYLTVTAPTTPGVLTISSCTFQSEYNTITGVVAGNQYRSTYNLGGWITVRHTTPNGTVVASGTSPLTWTATVSGTYYIHYNTNSLCGTASSCGTTTIECLSCVAPPAPANDLVCNATPIVCGQMISGTTVNATNSGTGENGICSVSQTMPGVWYRVTGNGQIMTAHLCNTTWDSKISVFSGTSCSALTCVGGNDDNGPLCVGTSASYQWTSVVGLNYYILVHGFSVNNSFQLGLTCTTPPPNNPTSISQTANPICAGNSTTLTANGAIGTVYWYITGCGVTQIGTGNSITVSPNATTTYYARNFSGGLFSNGCASTIITVNPTPIATITPTVNPICDGTATQLNTNITGVSAGSALVYSWSPGNTLSNPNASSPLAAPSATQTYTLTVTANGCSSTAQTTVTVNSSLPAAGNINGNNVIIAGTQESYSISPVAGASYLWEFTESVTAPLWLSIPNSNSPTVSFTWPPTTTDGSVRVNIYNPGTGCGNQTRFFNIIVDGVLPIELLSFSGKADRNNAILYWSTASEHNNEKFEIWRSKFGYDWEIVGTVPGAINSTVKLDYTFIDKDLPFLEYYYYKLNQVDFDGANEFSDIIAIHFDAPKNICTNAKYFDIAGRPVDIDFVPPGVYLRKCEEGTKRFIKFY